MFALIEQKGKLEGEIKLNPKYIEILELELSSQEKKTNKIESLNTRVFEHPKKTSTKYLTAYTICSECDCVFLSIKIFVFFLFFCFYFLLKKYFSFFFVLFKNK